MLCVAPLLPPLITFLCRPCDNLAPCAHSSDLTNSTPSPGGCSGQQACPHAQLGITETAHGPPLEHHQLLHGRSTYSLTHTPSWVYRRRLTGRLWNTTSCFTAAPLTHSLTRPAGCTGDGSRADSGTPPAASRPLHSLKGEPTHRVQVEGRLRRVRVQRGVRAGGVRRAGWGRRRRHKRFLQASNDHQGWRRRRRRGRGLRRRRGRRAEVHVGREANLAVGGCRDTGAVSEIQGKKQGSWGLNA